MGPPVPCLAPDRLKNGKACNNPIYPKKTQNWCDANFVKIVVVIGFAPRAAFFTAFHRANSSVPAIPAPFDRDIFAFTESATNFHIRLRIAE